jgi:hypothetical protein
MAPNSRGFGGRRRDGIDPSRIPPGQYYERGVYERSGSIDEVLGEVKHLVVLIRLAVETDADLSRDPRPIAWRPDVIRGNFAGPEIDLHADQRRVLNLGFHALKCPQNRSPGASRVLPPDGRASQPLHQASSATSNSPCACHDPPSEGGAFRCRSRQQKTAHLRAVLLLKRAPDGLEPSTPSLPWNPQATGRNPRQRFSPVYAVFAAVPFATRCDQLRPLGSIKAPSSVVYLGYAVEAPFSAGARCSLPKCRILSITRVLLAAWTLAAWTVSICYEAVLSICYEAVT